MTRPCLKMCDYSLSAVKTRDAAVDDKLTVYDFGTGTKGFAATAEIGGEEKPAAVCVRPGTEIAFDAPIKADNYAYAYGGFNSPDLTEYPAVAVFAQVDKGTLLAHHDCLQFPDGKQVMLTRLVPGQTARVLQLPAAPTTPDEAKAQERVAFAG